MARYRLHELTRRIALTLCSIAACAAACASSVERPWVFAHEYDEFHVVVPEDVPPATRTAAEEFIKYWERTTSHTPSLGRERMPGKINVWIGSKNNPHVTSDDLAALGPDGILIRSGQLGGRARVSRLGRSDLGRRVQKRWLVLAGDEPRGPLYAVYEFFERYMGIRWLTPWDLHVPDPPPTLPVIDYAHSPPFAYRDVNYWSFVNFPEFATARRQNGHWSNLSEEFGGHIGYDRGFAGYGHTFYYYVDPEEYFDDHPEYFAEIRGRRRPDAQLCLTNKDVLAITIEKVREQLEAATRYDRIVSVSQIDDFGRETWCSCTDCKALDEHEGSHAGSIIHFVNQVADAIAGDYPDAYIDTFAYTYSRKPPRHVRPRDNVIVRYCAIEGDFSTPLNDSTSARNSRIAADLEGWTAITTNLIVWDYTQNWFAFQAPHPNFHVFQPNAQFFAELGVTGVFEQASWNTPHSDYELLKGYMLSNLLWDPEQDWRALYDEFIDLYYFEAGPFVREYLDLVTNIVRQEDVIMPFYSRARWMDYDTVLKAQAIFEDGLDYVQRPGVRRRLKIAQIPVHFAALMCPPKQIIEGDAFILRRPPSLSLDEYMEMLRGHGTTHLEDWPLSFFPERIGNETPPREERVPYHRLANDTYEVWTIPQRGGSIVRWKDLRRDLDLIAGYTDISDLHHIWRDWFLTPEQYPDPVTGPLTVQDSSETHITMSGALPNGLAMRKRIELIGDAIAYTLVFTNGTGEPQPLRVRAGPEVSFSEKRSPVFWKSDGVRWQRVELENSSNGGSARAEHSAEGVKRWAVDVGGRRDAVVADFNPEQVASVRAWLNRPRAHADLEVMFPVQTLDPGESFSTTVRFSAHGVPPRRLSPEPLVTPLRGPQVENAAPLEPSD